MQIGPPVKEEEPVTHKKAVKMNRFLVYFVFFTSSVNFDYGSPNFQTIPQNHAYPDQNGMITYPGPAGFIDAYGANFTPR